MNAIMNAIAPASSDSASSRTTRHTDGTSSRRRSAIRSGFSRNPASAGWSPPVFRIRPSATSSLGHRLTFQLFAQSPPFAHLAAVYRNFDRDVPLRFVHKSAGRGITFARIQYPASTRSRVTWSEHWTAKSGLRRLCPIADKGSTHDLETEGRASPTSSSLNSPRSLNWGVRPRAQPEKTCHSESTAGPPSTTDMLTNGQHRRSVPPAEIA